MVLHACHLCLHVTSWPACFSFHRCQKESQGINYVAFLGDKYGRQISWFLLLLNRPFSNIYWQINFHKSWIVFIKAREERKDLDSKRCSLFKKCLILSRTWGDLSRHLTVTNINNPCISGLPHASVSKRGLVRSHWYKNDFYSRANKTHFHKKGCALDFALNVSNSEMAWITREKEMSISGINWFKNHR